MATTKKTTAKKTVKKVEEPVVEPVENTGEAIEKATLKRISEEEKVSFIIPVDPRFPSDQQFWEHNINGVNYRFPRGEELELPKSLADVFIRKLKMQQESAVVIGQWQGKGKKLDV